MPINNLTHFFLIDFENVPGVDLSVLGRHPMVVTLFLGPKSKLKAGLVEQITTLPFEVRLIKVGLMKKNALDFVLAYHLGEMVPRYPRGHYYIVSKDQDFEPLITHLREHNLHITQHPDLESLPFLIQQQPVTSGKAEPPPPATIFKPVAPPVKTAPPVPVTVARHLTPSVKPAPPLPVTVTKPVKAASPTPVVIAKPVAPKTPVVSREDKFIAGLKSSKKSSRPSTIKRLQAHIKNALGKEETAEKVEAVTSRLIRMNVLSVAATTGKVTYK